MIPYVSNETIIKIKQKSADALPNHPTASGYSAQRIKDAFVKPMTDPTYSLVAEINRVIDAINSGSGGGDTIIVDNLRSNDSSSALSANQGRILNEAKSTRTESVGSVDISLDENTNVLTIVVSNVNGVQIYTNSITIPKARKQIYNNDNVNNYTHELDDLWFSVYTTFSITNNLTLVSTSNSSVEGVVNEPYTATLTPSSLCHISSVVVSMGGIVGNYYSNGVVSIPSVTGSIVITAVAVSDYTYLNYIQSSGTQYINTGYMWTSDIVKTSLDFELPSIINNTSLIGSESSVNPKYTGVWYYSGTLRLYFGSTPGVLAQTISINTEHNIQYSSDGSNLTAVLDDVSSSTAYTGGVQKTLPLFIFANNINGSASQLSTMKFYGLKMWDNNVLVRDFVPVKNLDNVIGLLDRVEEVFYTNQGSGNFTI